MYAVLITRALEMLYVLSNHHIRPSIDRNV